MKKRILLFCDYYLPSTRAGGPVRSIAGIIQALQFDFAITVVTRNHDLCVSEPYENIVSDTILQADGYQIIYLSEKNKFSGIRALLKNNHYDILYFNSFFSPYFSVLPQFFEWIARSKRRIIISPRGELGDGALTIKNGRKKYYIPFFRWIYKNKHTEFLISSDTEKKEVNKTMQNQFPVTVLANMVNHSENTNIVCEKKDNHLNIVFVSRISKKKNIEFALNVLSTVKGKVSFDIYGPIEEKTYWDSCLQFIAHMPNNVQVTYRGALHPDHVTQTIQPYDLFFLPSLNENYGHAIVEALSAGCPVLLSDQTPWHDLSLNNAGWEFALSKPAAFTEKIDSLIAIKPEEYTQYKKAALDYYCAHIVDSALIEKYKQFFYRVT